MLYCPANVPKYYYTAICYGPDAIIFDFEDSVAITEKDAARHMLYEGLKTFPFEETAIFVRINGVHTRFCEKDIEIVVKAGVQFIRCPMCETASDIAYLDDLLNQYEYNAGKKQGTIAIQVGIETPKGVLNAAEMACASKRVMGLSFGAEDYTASLGISRTASGDELMYARQVIVNAASAYGLEATDSVWANIKDESGFKKELEKIKAIGFHSKACIHPSQIEWVHRIFAPSDAEIAYAGRIMKAVNDAEISQGGVIQLDGKMVDVPVIQKAKTILAMVPKTQ